jgi:hypothetical protein
MSVLRDLLGGAIDYAGLFPPAGLGMGETVRRYQSARTGPDRWALGRLVLPVSRLPEFEREAASLLGEGDPWPLSVLGGSDLAGDLALVRSFRDRNRRARIDSIELKASTPGDVDRAASAIDGSIETFYEIPIAGPTGDLLSAIKKARGRAKIRTGGTEVGSIPSADLVARFLGEAAGQVAFKATAGLHHPVRCVRPLTYEPGSPKDRMHGFLNVFLAAVLARSGGKGAGLRELLGEEDPRAFRAGPSEMSWRQQGIGRKEIAQARAEFILSFGSCSFDEPMEELREMGLE